MSALMSALKKGLTLGGIIGAGGIIGFELFKSKPAKAATPTASSTVPLAPHPANATTGAIPSSGFSDFPKSATVATSSTPLTIRNAPSASAGKVGSAAKGSTLQITGPAQIGDGTQSAGWAPVSQGATTGFASLNFLKVA